MGNNHSKFDQIVQEHFLAETHRQKKAHTSAASHKVVQMPVTMIRPVSTTTQTEDQRDMAAKVERGWIPWCADHGIVSKRRVRAAMWLAWAFGMHIVFEDNWQKMVEGMQLSDEEAAIRVMWTLEGEVRHPWRMLSSLIDCRSSSSTDLLYCMRNHYIEAKRLFKEELCWCCRKARTDACHLRHCMHCEVAKYCSKACQAIHWLEHKAECADLRQEASAIQTQPSRSRTDANTDLEPDPG